MTLRPIYLPESDRQTDGRTHDMLFLKDEPFLARRNRADRKTYYIEEKKKTLKPKEVVWRSKRPAQKTVAETPIQFTGYSLREIYVW